MTAPVRAGLSVLVCCCAGLTAAACTAGAPAGPDATVTTPSASRPPAPSSAQAALSAEAFTPYAGLGASADDGLAPGDTYGALHTACMNDAGYGQYAAEALFGVRENRGLAFAQPSGPWGYLGTALAAQDGFAAASGGGGQPGGPGSAPVPLASLPAGPQAAAGKCLNIVADFNDAQFAGSMAGIETMNDDISTDVVQDADFKQATKAWSACMARHGYSSPDPGTLARQEEASLGLIQPIGEPASSPTAAQDSAQIAAAVADADCTQAADLAGIYFAVQASYEQQFVSANQQALNTEVRQYKAAFARELSRLPALLRTASATPEMPGGARRPGQPAPGRS